MAGLTYLNLPSLDQDLIDKLIVVADQMPVYPDNTKYESKFHGYQNLDFSYTDNMNRGRQDRKYAKIPEDIFLELQEKFYPYVGQVYPTIIQFVNLNPDSGPTHSGPHCDMFRPIGLNYLLRPGGANVTTKFFKETRRDPEKTLTQSEFELESKLNLLSEYTVAVGSWHVVETQRFHMVANVEHKRTVLGLVLDNLDLTYETFCQKYKHLIID